MVKDINTTFPCIYTSLAPPSALHSVRTHRIAFQDYENKNVVGITVVYHGRGEAQFYLYSSSPRSCLTDITKEQLEFIVKGVAGACGDILVERDDDRERVCISCVREDQCTERLPVPQSHYADLKKTLNDVLSDYDLMARYTDPGDGGIVVEDPAAKRVLAGACLRDVYEDLTTRLDYDNHEHIAEQLVNNITTVDVNKFLEFSGCRFESEKPDEPLVKTLLNDREMVIKKMVRPFQPPSVEYFIHVRRCHRARKRMNLRRMRVLQGEGMEDFEEEDVKDDGDGDGEGR